MCIRILLILLCVLPASAYDLADFAAFANEWQTCRRPGYTPQWDLSRDGCVGLEDLQLFLDDWIMSYPNQIQVSGDISPDGIKSLTLTKITDDFSGTGLPAWGYNFSETEGATDYPSAVFGYYTASEKWELGYIESLGADEYTWASSSELSFPFEVEPIEYEGVTPTGTATVSEYTEAETVSSVVRSVGSNLYNLTRDCILSVKPKRKLYSKR